MKTALLFTVIFFCSSSLWAQSELVKYPEPEFSDEVYYLKKDTACSAIRLEKESAKMESKTKMGGIGGMEQGYTIEDTKSKVRIGRGNNLSFVFSTGVPVKAASSQSDSLMNANGMDPNMMQNMMSAINNPLDNIILYKLESEKGKRKILMQKSGSAFAPNSKKIKSSAKYTFSIKKIREGYSEMVIDKTLLAGEYAFTMMDLGMGGTGGDVILFAFGID